MANPRWKLSLNGAIVIARPHNETIARKIWAGLIEREPSRMFTLYYGDPDGINGTIVEETALRSSFANTRAKASA